jgi:hypothetical protein
MSVFVGRTALLGAAIGAAGIYYEYTPLVVAATVVASVAGIGWFRMTAPHDHWAELRRRNPSDP